LLGDVMCRIPIW